VEKKQQRSGCDAIYMIRRPFSLGAIAFKPLLMPWRKELDTSERETAGDVEDNEQELMRMETRTQSDGMEKQ
jgi:hypothetical protein